jgi:glycosyltransferase involved in cell wall biosynthesis
MKSLRFSIITICFNSEKTIERTIKSVLAQSYKNYEYIVVDGASKDNTLDIVKRYEPLFEGRMKWKSEPDNGIYDAMNKGIKRATGDIIGIVNSDDWLEQDTVNKVAEAIEKNDRDMNSLYCGDIVFHYNSGEQKRMDANIPLFKKNAPLWIMNGIRHPATFVPRNVYDKIGLFNDKMKLSADQDFILRCYFQGIQFYHVTEVLSNMAAGGLSTDNTTASLEASIHDRKIMLAENNIYGLKRLWLWYTWRLMVALSRLSKRIRNK